MHILEVKAGISDHDFAMVNADLRRPVKTRPVLRKIYFYKKDNMDKIREDLDMLNETLNPDLSTKGM